MGCNEDKRKDEVVQNCESVSGSVSAQGRREQMKNGEVMWAKGASVRSLSFVEARLEYAYPAGKKVAALTLMLKTELPNEAFATRVVKEVVPCITASPRYCMLGDTLVEKTLCL